jgi:hypothetical protein
MPLRFKFKGRIPDDDLLHQLVPLPAAGTQPMAGCVCVPGVGQVPQYAKTIVGQALCYDPATDCQGYFTSSKFQVHNNCYNYALDIASNSMAQPGRKHGLVWTGDVDGDQVVKGAQLDGLILVGQPGATINNLRDLEPQYGNGHFVALLIAPPVDEVTFPGDFHWVRCDDLEYSRWSQKDGPDQVTNFDFAGAPIADPSQATWTVNSGPFKTTAPGSPDFVVTYQFKAWMFVPHGGVEII